MLSSQKLINIVFDTKKIKNKVPFSPYLITEFVEYF